MIDIFKPQISEVTKGIEGKLILLYGTNRTGKTQNAVKAKNPFVIGFERGLNAISNVPYIPISKWRDWVDVVKQLTGAKMEQAKETYSTIIVDTIDAMGDLASEYICGVYGADTVGSGNNGYGLWKELSTEINKWLRTLTNAGYTVIFIAHEGDREFQDEEGKKFTKIYPRGEKRVVDPICDLCDFIGYCQPQSNNIKGENVLSTLYLVGNKSFHAGSRFDGIEGIIPEWNMEKLEKVISDVIQLQEKKTGKKAVEYKVVQAKEEEVKKGKWDDKTLEELIELIINKGQFIVEKEGNPPTTYVETMFNELGTRDFKVSNATEQQRPQLEQFLDGLEAACEAKGYC